MNEWHDFFIAMAGAAAALTGLIFVGVSINMTKILSFPKLPDRALVSLFLLLAILITSSLMLIPHQSYLLIGIELCFISIPTYVNITRMDSTIYRNTVIDHKKKYIRNIIFNQVCMIPYVLAAIVTLCWGEYGIYWLVPGIVISFMKAIIDAWVLLVEINR